MKLITTYIHERLQALYPPEEIRFFVRLILSAVCGLSYNQQILCKDRQISENEKKQIFDIVERLVNMEPVQYILGETEFYSIPLKVNPSVLIPRHETEELVDYIIRFLSTNLHELTRNPHPRFSILDIGSGSGCMAVALAKHLPFADVLGVDVSIDALHTAMENARLNNVSIRFIQADILDTEKAVALIPGSFDLIVSNPPYVLEAEKVAMSANVLNYEPHLALFVPNDNPLLFYDAIADFALQKLTPSGMLFFEINPLCDALIIDLLHKKGFTHTQLIRDLSGKNRIVTTASLPLQCNNGILPLRESKFLQRQDAVVTIK